MIDLPVHIPTQELRISDVPSASAPWHVISRFALTFDISEKNPYKILDMDTKDLNEGSSLLDLRMYLFGEQRRWSHFGRPMGSEDISEIRRIVSLIREKLSAHPIAE